MVLNNGIPVGRQGFTLVELILVVALVAIMAVMISAALNPGELTNKGHDIQRKKDLGRIKIAFEDYYTDKGCYPSQSMIDNLVCDKNGFSPWLGSWPCDPLKEKYLVAVENATCPKWYKIGTNLQNRKDRDIPANWYSQADSAHFIDGTASKNDVNFGVSSPNISWYVFTIDPNCFTAFSGCYVVPGPGRCGALAPGQSYNNAYLDPNCSPQCLVSCCFNGNICNQ